MEGIGVELGHLPTDAMHPRGSSKSYFNKNFD